MDGERPVRDDDLLTTKEAARFLRVGESTLKKWRAEETGPPYLRVGRVIRYRVGALRDWVRQQERSDGQTTE